MPDQSLYQDLPYVEPYRIEVVGSIQLLTRAGRERALRADSYGIVHLAPSDVFMDARR